MKRWLLRIILLIIVLAAIGVVGVEVVLRGDAPRRVVVEQLQIQTGLVWTIGDLRTGWGGHATLRDVEVRLPLEQQPLLVAKEIRVTHTPILAMPIGGFTVEAIEIDAPVVDVVQRIDGSLNVQRALESIVAVNNGVANASSQRAFSLPNVTIAEATLRLINNTGEMREIKAATLTGTYSSAMAWDLAVALPGVGDVQGRIAPRGLWQHELNFQIEDFASVSHLLPPDALMYAPVQASGHWTGSWNGAVLCGRLELTDTAIHDGNASGGVDVSLATDQIEVKNLDLNLITTRPALEFVHLKRGELTLTAAVMRVQSLEASAGGIQALVSGELDLTRRAGTLQLTWIDDGKESTLAHRGSADLNISVPIIGDITISGTLASAGTLAADRVANWQTRAALEVHGPAWTSLSSRVYFDRFQMRLADQEADLSGTGVRVERHGSQIVVRDLAIPDVRSQIAGDVDLSTMAWSLATTLTQWLPPAMAEFDQSSLGPIDLRLSARGDRDAIDVSEFSLHSQNASMQGAGVYRFTDGGTLHGNLSATVRPDNAWSIAHRAAPTIDTQPQTESPLLNPLASILELPFRRAYQAGLERRRSTWHMDLVADGTLAPLNMNVIGRVIGSDVPVQDSRIPHLAADFTSRIGAHSATIVASDVNALGGTSEGEATIDKDWRSISARFSTEGLSLQQVADMVAAPVAARGVLAMNGTLQIPDIRSWREGTQFDGSWSCDHASLADQSFKTASGRVRLRDQILEASDVRAIHDEGATVKGSAAYDLQTRQLSGDFEATGWPLQTPGGDLRMITNATGRMRASLPDGVVVTNASVMGELFARDQPLGDATFQVEARGSDATLKDLNATILGGTVTGNASMPLEDWQQVRADLNWNGIDLTEIQQAWPGLAVLAGTNSPIGTIDGTARVMPASDPHAPEPVQIALTVHPRNVAVGPIAMRESTFTVFVGNKRVMIDASHLALGQGDVDLWASLSWTHDRPFAHVQAVFTDVSLDRVVHLARPELPPVPGLLTGRFAVGGHLNAPHRAFGQAEVALRESDIANLPLISVLYSTLNLKIDKPELLGEGLLHARLDGDALEIMRLSYYNRGVDVVARVRLDDVWSGGTSGINGFAAGALRPLKNIDLPLLRDLDTAMEVLQAGAGSVRVTGTVAKSEIKPVPFAEIAGSVKSALAGIP